MAYAAPEALVVLQALRLVDEGCWTKAAEPILWRDGAIEWSIDFSTDPRFIHAAVLASEHMPDDIRAEMDKLVAITDDDIATWEDHSTAYSKELNAKFGPEFVKRLPP